VDKKKSFRWKNKYEHHSFFFPDNGHGAADAADFGWRNGG
jgi:hypothetical protein